MRKKTIDEAVQRLNGIDNEPIQHCHLAVRLRRVFLVSSLAQTDALATLLIEKGIITQQEFLAKISEERATYQAMIKPTSH